MEEEKITKTALIIVGNVLGDSYEKSKLYDATFSTKFRCGEKNYFLIACTEKAYELANMLKEKMHAADPGRNVHVFAKISAVAGKNDMNEEMETLSDFVGRNFESADGFIFLTATGIAVRTIAPYLKHKSVDPAVLVMDEGGNYCISLLSGHAGGANELSREVAELTGAKAVITTATDVENRFAVDDYARRNHMKIRDWKKAKEVSARILGGEDISFLTDSCPVEELPKQIRVLESADGNTDADIFVSNREDDNAGGLQLIPENIVAGIGCKKGTSFEKIEAAVLQVFTENRICPEALSAVATIDLKAEETGLIRFAEKYRIAMETYSAEELEMAEGNFHDSEFVRGITGTGNVCERSASMKGRKLLTSKFSRDGVTVALAEIR